ncbi:MAG: hypothetical protein PHW31_01350 [Candidatus Pacebacteria bacterium]|nr:hypothetical protein [Candidatus Paceibacterota bacterium]
MVRQVIDITTPNEDEEEQFSVVLASVKPKKPAVDKKKEPKIKKRKKTSAFLAKKIFKIPAIVGGAIVIVGVAFLVLSVNAKLVLKVKPVLEPIKMEEEIQVSPGQKEVDFEKMIMPGQLIETEAEKWETFQSTGKETEQVGASGTIFVYNSINPPMPLVLKESTRFLSSKDGKIFKAKSKVSLPPATLSNGKLTPSVTEVPVVAQQQGEEYNIAPAKFSVPGLAGTALYYSIWGESKQKIEGGSQKEVTKITQADFERAQGSLAKTLKEMALTSLQKQVGEELVLEADSVAFEEPDFSCSQQVGAELPAFNCYSKIKAKALIFKKSDLDGMAKNFISSVLSSNKKLYQNSLMTSVIPKGAMAESNTIVLNLKIEAKLYSEIDQQGLIGSVAGKGQKEIKDLVANNYLQIETVELKFWPFWVKKAPKDIDKIKLEMAFSPL